MTDPRKIRGATPSGAANGGTPSTGPGRIGTGEEYAIDEPELPPGAILGKYSIVRRLGGGGMGAVYEAMHIEIQKPVALKVLSNRLSLDPRAQTRFLREAAAASRLDHPHVVNVTDYGSENGLPFLVMEILRGEDLAAHIERHQGALPVETTANIMLAVCAGVYAAHEAGIVHRDLKPQNIFLARTPLAGMEPKVLDFGISKVDDDRARAALTNTGMVLGTTHYLSPEQVMGRDVDASSDQYALGVVLYECLTGRRPHEAETIYLIMRSIGEGTFDPPSVRRPDLPRELDGVVMRAMARDPVHRFESVHALGRALLPFASIRERIVWAEYYERERLETPSTIGKAIAPPGAAYLPRTSPIGPPSPGPAPLPATRTTHRDPASQRNDSSQAPFMPVNLGATGTEHTLRVSRRPWGWILVPAIGIGVIVAGLLIVQFKPGTSSIEPVPPVASPTTAPATSNPPRPTPPVTSDPATTEKADEPAALPARITIRVVDAPPGLRVAVDGAGAKLPLVLPRSDRNHVVMFQAPGHEPKAVSLDATRDRDIELNMQRIDEPPAAKPKPPRAPRSPRPDQRPAPAPPPGVIIDI